jgi:hypothetical protein
LPVCRLSNLPGFLLVKREPSPDGQQQTDLVSRHSRKVVYSAFVSPGPKYDCLFEGALKNVCSSALEDDSFG